MTFFKTIVGGGGENWVTADTLGSWFLLPSTKINEHHRRPSNYSFVVSRYVRVLLETTSKSNFPPKQMMNNMQLHYSSMKGSKNFNTLFICINIKLLSKLGLGMMVHTILDEKDSVLMQH